MTWACILIWQGFLLLRTSSLVDWALDPALGSGPTEYSNPTITELQFYQRHWQVQGDGGG